MNFENYQVENFYDELFDKSGLPRSIAAPLIARLKSMPQGDLKRQQKAAEAELLQMGITFTVYGTQEGTEKIFPFDIIPRVIEAAEWKQIESGLTQRIQALNLFIDDIYHGQKILKDKIIPADMVKTSFGFRYQCLGLNPPRKIWIHITGTDLVRDNDRKFYVLEDNLRCPSGVSCVLENRAGLKADPSPCFPIHAGAADRRIFPPLAGHLNMQAPSTATRLLRVDQAPTTNTLSTLF